MLFVDIQGQGPTVAWVHNAGSSHRMWDELVASLPGYRHVRFDLPGFGDSPTCDKPSLAVMGAMVGQGLVEHGCQDAPVVGHCVGSACLWWAMRAGIHHGPGLLSSPATLRSFGAGPFGPLRNATRRRLVDKVSLRLARRLAGPSRGAVVRAQLGPADSLSPRARQVLEDLAGRPDHLAQLHRLMHAFGSFSVLDQPHVLPEAKRVLVWGTHNRVLPIASRAHVAKCLQPKQDIVLPRAGHLALVANPAGKRLVRDFVREHAV